MSVVSVGGGGGGGGAHPSWSGQSSQVQKSGWIVKSCRGPVLPAAASVSDSSAIFCCASGSAKSIVTGAAPTGYKVILSEPAPSLASSITDPDVAACGWTRLLAGSAG